MNIVLLESLGISKKEMADFSSKLQALGHEFKAYERVDDISKQIEYAKDAEILIIANMPLSGEVIRACTKLKFIDVAFTGIDHIDMDTVRECNIDISNASGYSNQSVAELAICMMLNLLRYVKEVEIACKNSGTKDGFIGQELAGKTVGIIGTGEIGRNVAKCLNVFGCKVLGYRRNPVEVEGIEHVSLETLLKQSDIISLHCPSNASTKNLINKDTLSLMKTSAILINTARGAIVNQEDLVEALNTDKIRAAGIDVFDIEPPLPKEHIMLQAKNMLITPHIAYATDESMIFRKNIVFENIVEWLNGSQINKV